MAVLYRVATLFLIDLITSFVCVNGLDPVLKERVLGDNIQNLDLIVSSLSVMTSTLLDFESNVRVIESVSCEPYSREVAPSEFLHDDVSLDQDLTYMHWVIPANLVISDAFIFALVTICEQLTFR